MPSAQEYYDAALGKIQDTDSFFNRPKKEERKKILEEACDCLNSALSQGMLDAGIKLLEIYEKNKSVLFDKTTAEDLLRLMEQLIYKIIKILPDDEEKQKDIIHKLVALIEQFKDGELLCTMSRACSSSLMTNEILDLAHRSTTKKGDAKSKVMASYCYLALSERDDLPSEVYDSEETKVKRLSTHILLQDNEEAKKRCQTFLDKFKTCRERQIIQFKPVENPRELAKRIDELFRAAASDTKNEEAAKELKELAISEAPYFYACVQYLVLLEGYGEGKKTKEEAKKSAYYYVTNTKKCKSKQLLSRNFLISLYGYIRLNDPFALEYAAVARREGNCYLSRHPVLARNYFMCLWKLEPLNELARAALIDMQMNGEGGLFDVDGVAKLLPVKPEDVHFVELAYQTGEYWVLKGHIAQHNEQHGISVEVSSTNCFDRARSFFTWASSNKHKLAELALLTLEPKPPAEPTTTTDGEEDDEMIYDSDTQQEAGYQQASGASTKPHAYTNDCTRLPDDESKATNFLTELRDCATLDEKEKKKMQDRTKSLFDSVNPPDSWDARMDEQEERDLILLNHYYSQNKLLDGLQQLRYRYQVAQLRGIYFSTLSWNQKQIRTYKNMVEHVLPDTQRPLHNMPIFSAAVYEHAGITDRLDLREETEQRLRQSARFVGYQLRVLQKTEAWQNLEGAPVELRNAMDGFLRRPFRNRLEQLQQLYTNNMDLFIKFIEWASKQQGAILPNAKSPFVSTGDIQSRHAAMYAHYKPYAEHHSHYPVITYGFDGKPSVKYTGALIMMVCDLVDILPDRNHHIPSLNADGCVEIGIREVPERESTFFAQVPAGRVKYIEIASYPSFARENYPSNFHHKYGITKKQYELFREIFAKKDQNKVDVLKYYLDAYLTAYRALLLRRRAGEYPERPSARIRGMDENKVRILYRNRHGTFSFHPIPAEFGERSDEASFLRRSFINMRSLVAGEKEEDSEGASKKRERKILPEIETGLAYDSPPRSRRKSDTVDISAEQSGSGEDAEIIDDDCQSGSLQTRKKEILDMLDNLLEAASMYLLKKKQFQSQWDVVVPQHGEKIKAQLRITGQEPLQIEFLYNDSWLLLTNEDKYKKLFSFDVVRQNFCIFNRHRADRDAPCAQNPQLLS